MQTFQKIIEKLKIINQNNFHNIHIPALWNDVFFNQKNPNQKIIQVNFPEFLLQQFDTILQLKSPIKNSKNPNIYNLFVRFGTAFDHNQDGKLQNINENFKETGTFLKTISLLPYLKNLGTEILYLLPITSIGQDGKKGDLGSPYSINNPYKLDENLNEPLLEMPVEEQFKALVDAAHHIGIKVVCEFIFRTSSKDSAIAIEHPEWFYWLKNDVENRNNDTVLTPENTYKYYGSPFFTVEELSEIRTKIENKDFKNLPEPNVEYQKMFSEPPEKVELIDGKLIGINSKNEKVKIPGAFADWPPDDIQPAWSDVTYLKLYDNPDFNYIAYNTVRMYDEALIQPRFEVTDLWRHIENIIPFYQTEFGIDGVMIDMGHALPPKLLGRIISKSRTQNQNFLFWEENFIPNENSLKAGFDLVLGYLPFDQHLPNRMNEFIKSIELKRFPIACFATPETHNTPRSAVRLGGSEFSKIAFLINKLLPLPTFIHSGFELGEKIPVNTGLGFENFDTKNLTVDKLPLFSTASLDWNSENNIINFICEANSILSEHLDFTDDLATKNVIKLVECKEDFAVIFLRKTKKLDEFILCAFNYSDSKISLKIDLQLAEKPLFLFGENSFTVKGKHIILELSGYGFSLLLVRLQ